MEHDPAERFCGMLHEQPREQHGAVNPQAAWTRSERNACAPSTSVRHPSALTSAARSGSTTEWRAAPRAGTRRFLYCAQKIQDHRKTVRRECPVTTGFSPYSRLRNSR
jgi:hypothetical protein